ncbi:hypothetical protein K470DRAFT_227796 [Piedraia hortae CBS 480.64]|uniref:Peptidase S54 rhomboid domain-containing protein n=1 Tax=Piedraia hortae CBS 480.64 TaxID=1314780 RepID=A0A6A7C680_9PEZI|nr:hypothetical protein K470DRAFT_227796 [Piedraia hortae CBS 480.64]
MPFAVADLSSSEISNVFDTNMPAEKGNYILKVLHWRRMSGALIDVGLDFPPEQHVSRDDALKGLTYLRNLDPTFDEEAAAQVWVEEESLRLTDRIAKRAQELGLYQKEGPAPAVAGEAEQTSIYGESALTRLVAANRAKAEFEESLREAKRLADETSALHAARGPLHLLGGVQPSISLSRGLLGGLTIREAPQSGSLIPSTKPKWIEKYETSSQTIKEGDAIPETSSLKRLAPAFLLTLAVVYAATSLAEGYTPPPSSARVWPDTDPAKATLLTLSSALGGAFILSRLPPVWGMVNRYFTIVPAKPYAVSLLGACVRHDTLSHVATNVAALWLVGLPLHEEVGRGAFVAVFAASACVGGFVSLAALVLRRQWASYVFGSSGAILGLAGASVGIHPEGRMRAFGWECPVPNWGVLLAFGGLEGLAAAGLGGRLLASRVGIDHVGHLGGLIAGFGLVRYLTLKRENGER